MKKNACELSSQPTLTLFGKSIAYHSKQRAKDKADASICVTQNDIDVNRIMRHSRRIKQLFLPVCLHEVKHEIANHYRDVKRKKATKKRIKASRRSLAAALHRLRKRNPNSKLAATARTIINGRRRTGHRRLFSLNSREVLQIPSFTYPRYEFQIEFFVELFSTYTEFQWDVCIAAFTYSSTFYSDTANFVDILWCLTRLAPN